MNDTNCYIFVVTDTEYFSGLKCGAMEVYETRAAKKMWPLYDRTRFRTLVKSGDLCLFYIAGSKINAQSVVSSAVVTSNVAWTRRFGVVDSESVLTDQPSSVLNLEKINTFSSPVKVRSVLDDLSFIPKNREKWGTSFQGGVRQISHADYKVFVGS
tara:strand:+ start:2173 stop:2640 length:468 start_codon:yes stop_codon:yes gene_type:complete